MLKALVSSADPKENIFQGEVSCSAIVQDDEALIMVAMDVLSTFFCNIVILCYM